MATKKYLDYAGLKRVLAKLLPGARKIWHGTQAEWNALSAAERDKYDQAEIIDDNSISPTPVATGAATNLVSGIPMSHNIIERTGNVCKGTFRWYAPTLTTPKEFPLSGDLLRIPAGFRPIDDGRCLPVATQWNTDSSVIVQCYMQRDGIMHNGNSFTMVDRADCYLEAVWITADDWPE